MKLKMISIFWSGSFFCFFLCCPLPYSLPLRSCAQTLRRGRQPEFDGVGLVGWLSKVSFDFFNLNILNTIPVI